MQNWLRSMAALATVWASSALPAREEGREEREAAALWEAAGHASCTCRKEAGGEAAGCACVAVPTRGSQRRAASHVLLRCAPFTACTLSTNSLGRQLSPFLKSVAVCAVAAAVRKRCGTMGRKTSLGSTWGAAAEPTGCAMVGKLRCRSQAGQKTCPNCPPSQRGACLRAPRVPLHVARRAHCLGLSQTQPVSPLEHKLCGRSGGQGELGCSRGDGEAAGVVDPATSAAAKSAAVATAADDSPACWATTSTS